jgi:L-asparaginase II
VSHGEHKHAAPYFSRQALLLESWRGGICESRHYGSIAVMKPTGQVYATVGDASSVTFMRSTAKPLQALPLILEGADREFQFTDPEIAIITASHNGEGLHARCVAAILKKIGLNKAHLHCGLHAPMDWGAEVDVPEDSTCVLRNTCSGKHAGMLARCVLLGADLATYFEPNHPVQRSIKTTISNMVGIPAESMPVGEESCTAPTFGLSVEHIALAYARLGNPAGLFIELAGACKAITKRMLDFPEVVGGTRGRSCTDIMRVCPHAVLAKDGAEGVYALSVLPNPRYPEGLGIAIKIEDGNNRATHGVVVEVLSQLGLLNAEQLSQLSKWWRQPTRNFMGSPVGKLLPVFKLAFSD